MLSAKAVADVFYVISTLFKEAVSISYYIAANPLMVNNESEEIWKELFVSRFEKLSWFMVARNAESRKDMVAFVLTDIQTRCLQNKKL
jgi:hypothetical protein